MIRRDALFGAGLLGPLLLVPLAASGQAACAAGRVAVVQTEAIFASIGRYAEKDTVLNVIVSAYRVNVSQLQGVVDSVTQAFQEKSVLLSARARQVERGKLDAQDAQIRRRILELRQQVAQQRERLLQPIEIGVQRVIDSIRTELKCGVIFDVNSATRIASVNKSLDLTQRVIDRIRATGDTAIFGPPDKGIDRRP